MNILFFLVLQFIGVIILEAQEIERKSVFSISTGYAWFNNGAQGGLYLSNDYIRNTSSLFTYGAKYYFAHGEGDVEGLEPKHDIHIFAPCKSLIWVFKKANVKF